jgi:hypothetical protein
VPEGWTYVAEAGPSSDVSSARIEVLSHLDDFLRERGVSRDRISGADLRINLAYLGPGVRACKAVLLVRTEALQSAS